MTDIAIKRIDHPVRYCTSNDRASEFYVNVRIYRFGTLGRPALVKQAKFADQSDFLLSSGFSAEWGSNGRYQVLWNELRNPPGINSLQARCASEWIIVF